MKFSLLFDTVACISRVLNIGRALVMQDIFLAQSHPWINQYHLCLNLIDLKTTKLFLVEKSMFFVDSQLTHGPMMAIFESYSTHEPCVKKLIVIH